MVVVGGGVVGGGESGVRKRRGVRQRRGVAWRGVAWSDVIFRTMRLHSSASMSAFALFTCLPSASFSLAPSGSTSAPSVPESSRV